MSRLLDRLLPDRFILWLLAAVAVATLLPACGPIAPILDWTATALIVLLFFLHGARLPREAMLRGLGHWRLHLAILATTFLLFPLAGFGLSARFPDLFSAEIWAGILFLSALPSTVQSSIAYTSLARGNVAGAVAAAAGSQLIGVFATPVIVSLMLTAEQTGVDLAGIGQVVLTLLAPFVVGHLARPLVRGFVDRHPTLVFTIDKGTILVAVYAAFSAAAIDGVWTRLPAGQIAAVAAVVVGLLALALGWTTAIGRLGFDRGDRVAILFCGSFKSVVAGVPMAHILFGPAAGVVILPIMIYHAAQLVACGWIAGAMAPRVTGSGDAARAGADQEHHAQPPLPLGGDDHLDR